MFAFSLPAPLPVQSFAPPLQPASVMPAVRQGLRDLRGVSRARRFLATDSPAGPSSTTSPADPSVSRVTGPRRSQGQTPRAATEHVAVTLGATEGRSLAYDKVIPERRVSDEADSGLDSEEVDIDDDEVTPHGDVVHRAPRADAAPRSGMHAPLLRVDSGGGDNPDAEDADLLLVNSYEHTGWFYGITSYLEIAAHQFIVCTFICACAMLSSHPDRCELRRSICFESVQTHRLPYAPHSVQPHLHRYSCAVLPRVHHDCEYVVILVCTSF